MPTRRYDPIEYEWTDTNMPIVLQQKIALISWNKVIYFVGGSLHRKVSDYVACYNFRSNRMTHVTPLTLPTERLGVTIIKGYPCIIGGKYWGNIPEMVQLYEPLTDEWEEFIGPTKSRYEFGILTLANCIYVIGGGRVRDDSEDSPTSKSVECFDIEREEWKFVSPMTAGRYYSDAQHSVGTFT